MAKEDLVQKTLKDNNCHLSFFSEDEIKVLRKSIILKEAQGQEALFVTCIIRDKDIQLKPEEIVRQLYTLRLISHYGYPKSRIAFEYSVNFGREKKKADIVVFDKDRPDTPYIIVEIKKTKLKDGKNQLRSYCNATGAPIGIWTNGEQISHYHRKDPNHFEGITDIPNAKQSLKDIKGKTAKELISIFIVPFILLAAFCVQLSFFRLARKKRKDDLFQLRFQYFKRLLEFWKQTEIDSNVIGVPSMVGKQFPDGINPKVIEYLNEKRNLITEAGFLFGSAAEEFLKKSATLVEMSNDVFSTNEYTEHYHPADLSNYFKPYLQIEK